MEIILLQLTKPTNHSCLHLNLGMNKVINKSFSLFEQYSMKLLRNKTDIHGPFSFSQNMKIVVSLYLMHSTNKSLVNWQIESWQNERNQPHNDKITQDMTWLFLCYCPSWTNISYTQISLYLSRFWHRVQDYNKLKLWNKLEKQLGIWLKQARNMATKSNG